MNLLGNGLANDIEGGSGNDTLDGGAGIDTMVGWNGNNLFIVDNSAELVWGEGGIDAVQSSASFNLLSNGVGIENLALTGSANITGIGNSADNIVSGNSGNNFLQGLGGNDELYGNAGADVLEGGAGSDYLDGGAGIDTMVGGAGDDAYIIDDINDVVTEYSGEGDHDVVFSSVSYTVGAEIENLTLTGGDNIDGLSSSRTTDNTIVGNSGNNTLGGGDGVDTLTGNEGIDTFVFANAGAAHADVVTDYSEGVDFIALDHAYFSEFTNSGDYQLSTGGWDPGYHVNYNVTNGQLSYSASGDGSGSDAVLIATLNVGEWVFSDHIVLV
jgi:Ca2+-binding RTX toxin-like protein